MKKKLFSKVVTVVATVAVTASVLAGCGNGENTETAQQSPASTSAVSVVEGQNQVEEVEAGEGMDAYTAFENTVTLKIPVYDRGGEVDVTNNYWTNWVQESFGDAYNINVQFVAIPRGDVLNAYANLANAGDLPTILMEYDFPKQAQWADDGYLQELDLNMLASIAPTFYNNMVSDGNLNYTALNGKTYFALARRPYWNNTYNFVTFYRADWAEQVGYSEFPDKYEDQLEMYKKIKEAGLCEYPLAGKKVTGSGVDQNHAFRTYPQDELEWATMGDYAIPALPSEASKLYIKRQNEQYNLGLINPEFYTREQTDDEADFVAGKAFTYKAYIQPGMPVLDDFYAQNPDAKLSIAANHGLVMNDDGTNNAYRPNNPFGMMIGFSATASEDEVKAAMMYMEWATQPDNLFTYQYGTEGETFKYDENGLPAIISDYTGEKAMPNSNKDYWCVTIESRDFDNIEDLIKLSVPLGYPDSEDFAKKVLDNYNGMVALAETGYIQPDCNFAVTIPSVAEYQENLLGKYEEFRTKLTTCKPEEFETLYAQFAQEYLDAGFQNIIDDRAEAYNNGMTSHLPK